MKRLIKQSFNIFIDLMRLTLFYVKFMIHGHYRLKRNEVKKSVPLYILGNGPALSLVSSELESNGDADICCVNFSPLTNLFFDLQPSFLVFADSILFNAENEQVRQLRKAMMRVDWDMVLIVRQNKIKQAYSLYGGNNKIKFIAFPLDILQVNSPLFQKTKYKLWKKGITMPSPINVIVAAIFCGINLGYDKIYLYGVDHSWLKDTYVSDQNIPCLKDTHYYGVKDVPWATHPNGNHFELSEVLEGFTLLFKEYKELQRYSEYLGNVQIINRTKGSWIDAFRRE